MRDERTEEIRNLATVANNLEFPVKMRLDAVETIGRIGTHDALLALLEMAGNDKLTKKERELMMKLATNLVKAEYR